MFRSHRSKKSATAEPEPAPSQQTSSADGATDANRSRNGLAANMRPNGPSTSPMTSSPPTADDLDDVDLPIDSRMRRNLTVSRSGRYKSKSRPRAALDQAVAVGAPVAPVEGPAATRSATAIPSSSSTGAASTASTGVATYNQVIASAAGPPIPSAYRGMTTAL